MNIKGTDIVKRLREHIVSIPNLEEAAAEIDRLRARNAELEDALRMVVCGGYDEASRVFAAEVATRAIIAKTDKEEK